MKISKEQGSKNLMVMEILTHVPEFKKDVCEIRKEFNIKEGGFELKKGGFEWNDGLDWSEIQHWASEKDLWHYSESEYNGSGEEEEIRKDFPSNKFEKRMLKIGIKYNLPFNFYAFPFRGVPYFIITGDIQAPNKNYDFYIHMDGEKFLWASLIMYASLSEVEEKEAMTQLKSIFFNLMPNYFKGVDTFSRKRYHSNIKRNLILLEEQIARSDKPKKIKSFVSGSYMDILNKSKTISIKKLKKIERLNKGSVIVKYDNLTSEQIGKKQGVSGQTTRQIKKQLNSLAKELFGYNLEP